jgi:dTMP kinase
VGAGRFITFEGGEGAGKSTQARRLADVLRSAGVTVTLTREPGGSPGAEAVRALLVSGSPDRWDALTEALLHFAARRDHVRATIAPALQRGDWVLCDRFADSTMAYQGYGLQLGREPVEQLQRLVLGTLVPDLTVVLDLPVAQGLGRAAVRGGHDRYERMDPAFHQRLRDGFLDIARREPQRCIVVDARGAEGEIALSIQSAVAARFGLALA